MPTYLYECKTCGEFEESHKISEKLEFCPKCAEQGKTDQPVERKINSTNGFVLQGSGWFKSGGY